MPHACISLYGVIHQHTIDEQEIIIPKLRAAHDQSFKFSSGSSVNSRVKTEKLTKLIYFDALRQIIHYIHSLCFHLPGTPIITGQFEFSAAYKRMTMWGRTSASSCTCHDDISYISLRLTFGCSPCPPIWCSISKMITNLANDILVSTDWDPSRTHSPHHAQMPKPNI